MSPPRNPNYCRIQGVNKTYKLKDQDHTGPKEKLDEAQPNATDNMTADSLNSMCECSRWPHEKFDTAQPCATTIATPTRRKPSTGKLRRVLETFTNFGRFCNSTEPKGISLKQKTADPGRFLKSQSLPNSRNLKDNSGRKTRSHRA